jgi:hypothetical protein
MQSSGEDAPERKKTEEDRNHFRRQGYCKQRTSGKASGVALGEVQGR